MSHASTTRQLHNSDSGCPHPIQTCSDESQTSLLQPVIKILSRNTLPPWRKYLTVEPVVFFYFYGFLMYIPVGGIYVYERVSEMKGFPYKNVSQEEESCGGEKLNKNSSLWRLEEEVQSLASEIGLMYNLCLVIPSLLLAPLWGPWTDRGGKRKPALQFAILGACLEMIVTLLVMYFKWSVYVLYLSATISGFCGFATVLMVGATAYIADISEKEERAFRIAMLYLAIFLAGVISLLTSGFWMEYVGFIPSIWFIWSCYFLAGVWTLFCVPEIPKPVTDTSASFFSSENIKGFVNLFRKQREVGRKNLFLLMFCGGVIFLSRVGTDGVETLYVLRSPLCWRPTLVGYYSAFEMFLEGIGSVVGVEIFRRCFREMNVVRIGIVTFMSASVLLAFSDRTWMIFVVGTVGIFNALPDPVLMGEMSKIVGQDEQGSLFSAYGVVTAVMQLVGAAIFNNVYQATLGLTFPGLVFVISAGLVIIPFVFVSFIELPRFNDQAEENQGSTRESRERSYNVRNGRPSWRNTDPGWVSSTDNFWRFS